MRIILKKLLFVCLLINTFLSAGFDTALKKQKFLSPDKAFRVSAELKDGFIKTKIKIADNIHVYDDNTLSYKIISPKEMVLDVKKPKSHNFDGDKVFEKEIEVLIPTEKIESEIKGRYTLQISFQGCSDKGICYQPITKSFEFQGAKAGFFDKVSAALKEGNASKISDLLSNESGVFVVLLFFLFGILLALTPCIFPMIPILSSIIISQQKSQTEPSVAKAFFTSLVYVVSMALTYTAVGIIAGLVGADIQTAMQNPWVLALFAAMFVALAFSLFGYYEIGLPVSWQSRLNQVSDKAGQKGGLVGTAIMGLLSALIVGPCVAPPLAGAVLFISHTGDALLGGMALFVMSMGMGLPLLLVGVGAGKFMPKPGGWMTAVSQVFGVMMLALAIFMLSRVLPESIALILWSLLFMGSALYMGVFDSRSESKGAAKLFKLLALVLMLWGVSLFIGAISGANSMLRPFEKFTADMSAVSTASQNKEGHLGYSIERLMKEVGASDKPVVVDFGKDSCTACTELEEITFPHPLVKEQLKHFTFIKIDLTENTKDDKAILKKYELFGTPNIIFFDKDNNYLPEKTLTGFIEPEVFAKHLNEIAK